MITFIKNGTIVNENEMKKANILISDDRIIDISSDDNCPRSSYDHIIDATGCLILPGCIDTHVHFREPGMTQKADIESESRAAAFGGVTSYIDMPNTVPQTTSIEALSQKHEIAATKSHINYSFFFGATNNNYDLIEELDPKKVPGIKLFMGSSTGNMLVDTDNALHKIFSLAASHGFPIVAHCEDTSIINRNMNFYKENYGEDPDVSFHPLIRSSEACYVSSKKAVEMAIQHTTRLHIAHLTTEKELSLLDNPLVSGEATVAHLLFDDTDYKRLGALIKCNPAIKTRNDRDSLRAAIADGTLSTIGTDHAPHRIEEKNGGAAKAVSGMPMLQFSLPCMMSLVDEGVLSVTKLVELMCHNPATLFGIKERGYIRKGYKADIAIISDSTPWTITRDCVQSKCNWTPLEGKELKWKVIHTICNGKHILNHGIFNSDTIGEPLHFQR